VLSNLNVSGRIGVKTTPSYDLHLNSSDYSATYIYSPYNGGTVANIVAGGTTAGTWGLYSYATTLGYAGYFSGNVYCTGNYLPSDEKLKENIQPIENSLDKIMQLDVMTYNYKTSGFPEMNLPTDRQNGFTAQNLESVFPELVKFNPAKKEQPVDFKAVNYTGLIPVLTAAIQEQQVLIEKMQKKIDELENIVKSQ
jgi:trimeric autotransporter adhesin